MTESLATHLSLEQVTPESVVLHYTKEQKAMLSEIQRQRITEGALRLFKPAGNGRICSGATAAGNPCAVYEP